VRDILLRVAGEHPQVLASPEPFVYLDEFGAHALNFTLYVYLANVSRSLAVRTDLRMAILKAFRATGIEIPYPQAEVHLRDLRWVKRMIAERMAKPQNGGPVSRRDFEAESGLAGDNDDEGD
jgi:small-conductance mechanosensitive channel